MCKIPRLRSIDEAHSYLVSEDPETGITKSMLRSLVVAGEIPYVHQGRKILLDIDNLPRNIVQWAAKKTEQEPQLLVKELCNSESVALNRNYGQVRAL